MVEKKKNVDHPMYIEMIKAAITALKEKKGSSRQAIEKYIKANYKVGDNVTTCVKMTLKRNVEVGRLIQTKGIGATGSFKLPAAKPAAKPKTTATKKKPASKSAKKPATKKSTPKKTTAKKPAAKKSPAKKKKEAKSPAKKTSPKKKTVKKSPKKGAKKSKK